MYTAEYEKHFSCFITGKKPKLKADTMFVVICLSLQWIRISNKGWVKFVKFLPLLRVQLPQWQKAVIQAF